MRQIDNMMPQEIETLRVKGMLGSKTTSAEAIIQNRDFELETVDAMQAATARRLETLKLALDQAFLDGVSFGLKQQSK